LSLGRERGKQAEKENRAIEGPAKERSKCTVSGSSIKQQSGSKKKKSMKRRKNNAPNGEE